MVIYLIVLLYWLLLQNLRIKLNIDNKTSFWLSVLPLFIIMGFKHPDVGIDTRQYIYRYEYYHPYVFLKDEWLFNWFSSFLNYLNFSSKGYIIIIGFILSFGFTYLYFKISDYPELTLYLHMTIGLFTMSMSGVRQSISVLITLFAFYLLKLSSGKIVKFKTLLFLLLVYLAQSIHASAYIFYVILFIPRIKLNKKRINILNLILILVYALKNLIIKFIMKFDLYYLKIYEDTISKYQLSTKLILSQVLITITISIIWNYLDTENLKDKQINNDLLVLSFVNSIFFIFAAEINMISRFSYFFNPYNLILIPNVIMSLKNQKLKLFSFYIMIVLPLIQFLLTTPGGRLQIDNFKFFWQ